MARGKDHSVLAPSAEMARLRRYTPARIALGRAGTGQPTAASLAFALDHARARDAVHAALDTGALEEVLEAGGWRPLRLASAAPDRETYLRRPDLGRRLDPASLARLTAAKPEGCDVAVVVADGLSALAVACQAPPLLAALRPMIAAQGRRFGRLCLVAQGRVAIGDEIGEAQGAGLALVLIGERPGLSAADSLGAYLTWQPRTGTMDSARHCISNIRRAGLPPEAAAAQIAELVALAFRHAATGLRLNEMRSATALPNGAS